MVVTGAPAATNAAAAATSVSRPNSDVRNAGSSCQHSLVDRHTTLGISDMVVGPLFCHGRPRQSRFWRGYRE